MSTTYYTLIFIKADDYVLLGYKKRGLGEKKWNGYGGKIEFNESIKDGATRELLEESNLVVDKEHLDYVGVITYKDNQHVRVVYIFIASQVKGELKETEEMKPKWFNSKNLPFENMWPDTEFWLPLILKGSYVQANFMYHDYKLYNYEIQELQAMPDVISVQS